jgi:adenylate cyclase
MAHRLQCAIALFQRNPKMTHQALIHPIREWLIDQALGSPDPVVLFESMCQRLSGIGIPIARARLIWQTLHPLFRAETVIWDRGQPAKLDTFPHQDDETPAWRNSPLRFVLHNNISVLRRQLEGENETLDFPILKELKLQGITDYLVLATVISHSMETAAVGQAGPRGVIVTWASDRPGGFSPDDLAALQEMNRLFAVICRTIIQSRVAANITSTYLGRRAGQMVLRGQIRRGDGEQTRAVVWFSDMRNSTMLAESLPSDDYFALLNAYFEATAGPLVEHGGEVLDFIGDGVLGILPFESEAGMRDAAKRANAALDEVLARSRVVNGERAAKGLDRFNFGVGLNVGDVKFGNIGIPQRLSFSVIGHSVNEVARIESMTKMLQQPVLSGGALANLVPDRWRSLGEHKLEGVLDPVELFAFQMN